MDKVTFNKGEWYGDKFYGEGECLSTDNKPKDGIYNGSKLAEMDTSTLYLYDEDNNTWRAWG